MSRPRLALALLMIAAPAGAQTAAPNAPPAASGATAAAPPAADARAMAPPAADAGAMAPPAADAGAPRNGLEQNGLNYQPTQGGTVSKEAAAGVRPSLQHQQKTDAELNQIDRQLLQSEGKNPDNAVNPTPR